MKLKILVAIAALATALPAFSVTQQPYATATIDWDSLGISYFRVTPVSLAGDPASAPAVVWDVQSSLVSANSESASADNWTSKIDAPDPLLFPTAIAKATANAKTLMAQFIGTPTSLNSSASANRSGTFSLTPYSGVVFTLTATTSIDMDVPPNGSAYAWAGFEVKGDGYDGTKVPGQGSPTPDKQSIVWANGSGSSSIVQKTIQATFLNSTDGYITGTLSAFAIVSGNGFIPAIPEPRTYAMMLAGLGLLGFVAGRRKLIAVPA